MSSNEAVPYGAWSIPQRVAYAGELAKASDLIPRGLFDKQTGRPSPAKIFLVLETGNMLGLHPMAALQGIDVVEGRAAIAPRLMIGLFRARGHRVKIEETGSVETGDAAATVTLWRADDPDGDPIVGKFTIQQALRAGLIDSYTQDPNGIWTVRARSDRGNVLPWEAYTEDLLVWRATARMGRRGGEDVLMGIGYIPEELEANVDEHGEVVYDVKAAARMIEEFKQFDDKADMADWWKQHHEDDVYDPAMEAEFYAHLATLQKDSRPEKAGAPGQTGHKAIDGPQAPETSAEGTDAPDPDGTPGDGQQTPDDAEYAAQGKVSPRQAEQIGLIPPDEDDPADADEAWVRAEVARHEAELANGEQ